MARLIGAGGRSSKAALIGTLSAFFVASLAGVATNVSKEVTQADRAALASIGITSSPKVRGYSEEVQRIATIQLKVLNAVRVDNSASLSGHAVEPGELLSRGSGACYEISRTLEKGLALNNFESRRVFYLYRQDRSLLSALVTKGHPSHAAVEVRTSRGWMLVDSIVPWIGLDKEGQPVSASSIWNRPERFDTPPPEHLMLSSWAIRGLYSRNGQLYGSALPAPELNWHDFGSWLISLDESRHLY